MHDPPQHVRRREPQQHARDRGLGPQAGAWAEPGAGGMPSTVAASHGLSLA